VVVEVQGEGSGGFGSFDVAGTLQHTRGGRHFSCDGIRFLG
jgi:hypothetical protein